MLGCVQWYLMLMDSFKLLGLFGLSLSARVTADGQGPPNIKWKRLGMGGGEPSCKMSGELSLAQQCDGSENDERKGACMGTRARVGG
ncbi:hypothetical protein K456DRAFT_52181 [Colletotrichum gloeosporioides 23]|nr:hypothetical protein K456DRAFT_52181 [Colletotrichum gloeosporioides 23]